MTSPISRRKFMKQSALAGTGFWVAGGLEGAPQQQPSANERVNVAVVGAGGQGASNIGSLAMVGLTNIVALCDVDDANAGQSYNKYPKATRYADFRVMLDKQRDIDAVLVATPDHMHAQVAVSAMRRGKHVYCEKPLCHDVWECRLIKEVAQRNKVATQMGNHGTAANGFRRGVEVLQAGALGDVREVHVWTNRPIWPQNLDRPAGTSPIPKTLNWDLWIGCAPMRPYHHGPNPGGRGTYLPFNWRGWWDFGTGALGDMACHTMNLPFMGLRLGYPASVIAELTTPLNPETGPEGCKITYEFPARGKLPPVTLYWYERRTPPATVLGNIKAGGGMGGMGGAISGCIIIGSRGRMYSTSDYGSSQQLLPEEAFKGYQDPTPTLPRTPSHHREWIDAIKGGRPALSNFVDYAALLTETVLLGIVALRSGGGRAGEVGKRVVWNAEKMQCVDNPEADRFIRREYRRGWDL